MSFYTQKRRVKRIKSLFRAINKTSRFFNVAHLHLLCTIFVFIAILVVDVPFARSAPKSPIRAIGTTQTLNVYPSRIEETNWQGYQHVLSQDVSANALFDAFSKNNAAFINTDDDAVVPLPDSSISDQTVIEDVVDASQSDEEQTDASGVDSVELSPTDVSEPVSETPATAPNDVIPESAVDEPVPEVDTTSTEVGPVSWLRLPSALDNILPPNRGTFLFAQETAEMHTDVQVTEPTPPSPASEMLDVSSGTIDVTSENSLPSIEPETSPDVARSDEMNTDSTTVRSITLADFGTAALAPGQSIKGIQLRASLAAKLNTVPPVFPTLTFTAQTPTADIVLGSIVIDDEISNALNGGYFLFAFPENESIESLAETEITVTFTGDSSTLDGLYLDALWLEVEIESLDREALEIASKEALEETLVDPTLLSLMSEERAFIESELPSFNLRYNAQRSSIVQAIRALAGRDLVSIKHIAFVHKDAGDLGITPKINLTKDGLLTIQIEERERERLRPGEYTIELILDEGGVEYTDSFTFQWGMLAINTDQTMYGVADPVSVMMGALSPSGNTICDAHLELYVIDPSDIVSRVPVTSSTVCNGNNVIDEPDYIAALSAVAPGSYELYLEHYDEAGAVVAYASATFLVADDVPLAIKRSGPTRIYPRATYPMELTVISNQVWEGELVEVVPADFVITETNATIRQVGDTQELVWDIAVVEGQPVSVSYTFDAPDISPYLYTLGSARLEGSAPTYRTVAQPANAIIPDSAVEASVTDESLAPAASFPPEPSAEAVGENAVGSDNQLSEQGESAQTVEPVVPAVLDTPAETDVPAPTPEELPVSEANEPQPVDESAAPQAYAPAVEFLKAIVTAWLPSIAVATTSEEVALDQPVLSPDTSTSTASATQPVASGNEPVVTDNVVFVEHRQWQIASDATGSMILYWTNAASIPSGWTCLSCGSGTYYQRFAYGSSTYNTTGGAATHTHTASGTVNASTGANAENNAGSFVSIVSHSHTYTPTVSASTSLPAYRNLRVIQSNSAGEPTSIPAGALMIFDSTLPAGWTRYSALDNRYPRGENAIGNAGSSTHRHAISGSTGAAQGTSVNSRNGGTQVTSAANTHTHTVSGNSGYTNHEPPYITVIFATTSSATSTPTGAIAMWSDTPPAQWIDQSSAPGTPFNNRFIRGSATYGSTGGNVSHTHANFSITSGAAVGTDNARTGSTGASNVHTHQVDISSVTTATHLPPYLTTIFGRKYGAIPLYTQQHYRFYANANANTPTDPWPTGVDDLTEDEAISSENTAAKNADVVRLRLQLNAGNSTSTGESFKLQYGTTTLDCTDTTTWTDVGSTTSSALWRGYNNAAVSDGATLSSTVLTGTDIGESYEEQNPSVALPNQIGYTKNGEWDFVMQQNGALPNTTYCFRMVKSDGSALYSYSIYPQITTNQAPTAPDLVKLFDNEKIGTTTPAFEFAATDAEGDSLTYQIQVDDTYAFSSTVIDRSSDSNGALFDNLVTPADKDPFNQGETIQFEDTTALSNNTTYYWRVRAKDSSGSNAWSSWSTIQSFTVDTSVTVSTWFQTMEPQFDANTLIGVEGVASNQAQLVTGSTTGTMYSDPITFSEGTLGTAWASFSFNDTETSSDLKYTIQYNNSGTWTDIPDTALPGNSAGFDASPVSLLTVDKTTYTELRIEATFTNSGASPSLQDWTVSWGYTVETPTTDAPFSNEKVSTTTPTFVFTTTDPQSDDLQYEIQWSTSYAFTASTTRLSGVHAGFTNLDNGADTSPFTSGDDIQFKIQAADALTNGTTYWWRVRARDPLGANTYSFFTDPQSFTVDTSVTVSTWFQTTQSQFNIDTLSNITTLAAGSSTVSTTTNDTLLAYAEGNITTPRYRLWDGAQWGSEQSAADVGATINWVVTKASPSETEYVMATLGSDADVNVQVYRNGAWSDLQELTTVIPNTSMRGVDVAYEQSSGDALVVTCDGDANPTYWTWNGSSWTNGGGVGLTSGNTCGWVRLIADPTSDEIIVITRDTSGTSYEARVWTGSAWGNSATWGSMAEVNHEGIAAVYEESGNQAVVVVSNGTASSFSWRAWDGTNWSAATAVTLGDDFENGTLAADDGSDNLVFCYVDQDNDIGALRWTGAGWSTPFTELETAWVADANGVKNEHPVDCAYEVGGSRDGYATVVYSDTTNLRYRYWNGSSWVAEATVSTIEDSRVVQVRRPGDNSLQAIAFDTTNDRYDFSRWNGSTWSSPLQTLEMDASVGAVPYKEPFMNAVNNPSIVGAVAGEAINFYDGSGPYWQQFSWSDLEPGASAITYQIEYYDGDSWELVPNTLISGNSSGLTSSPVSLSGVLPVSTYHTLRPIANLSCNLSNCPSLNHWTVTWAAGITISGTAQQYNQSSNLTSGTVAVAVNGVLQTGKTGSISAGAWSIANVNVSPGDTVTVFISGAADSGEAAAITTYDGVGDISGFRLYERHLTIGSDDRGTVDNTDLATYDFTNTEDIFFDVNGTSDLTLCATTGCADAELYITAGNTYSPGTGADVTVHDFENNGTFTMGANTVRVSGSWDNNATTTPQTSTVIFTATSTTESLDETGALSPSFYNLTFGQTSGTATWTLGSNLTVTNDLAVSFGTFARNTRTIGLSRNLTNGASGYWTGIATTTFTGTVSATWSDANTTKQNIGHVVVDGTTKTTLLGSDVRAQSLTIGANDTFDASTGNYDITVLGNWTNNNNFNARSGDVFFGATTTARTITVGGDAFYNVTFSGAGGGWSFTESTLAVNNDVTINNGTVTLPTATTTITGSFINSGGTFVHNNSLINFTGTASESVTLSGGTFTNALYNVRFSGSGTYTFTEARATTTNDMRITAGTVVFPSAELALGGSLYQTAGSITAGGGTLRLYSASAESLTVSTALNSLLVAANGPFTFTNANATLNGSLIVNAGTLNLPSGTFSLGGSLDNNATINPGTGTVLFNSSTGSETVALGGSSLYNATFNSATGIWTIIEPATTTNNATLTAGTFTLGSSQTLAVGATFTNSVGGASTTWTGATLALNGGTFSVNTKTNPGDTYDTLHIAGSADVSFWNSSASSVTIGTGGSLYSQDHAAVDGTLYIYGSYARSSGTEYWSYATDFDGTSLGGSSRTANVRFASGASASLTGSTLQVLGSASASSTIANQGSGTYTVSVSGGAINARYYTFADLGSSGLSLLSGTSITNLDDGAYTVAAAAGSALTVASSTIDANPGHQIFRTKFSTTTAISAFNVSQTGGAPSSYWWFRNGSGNLYGEAYDSDTGDPGSVRFDDSSLTITVSGTVYSDAGATPLTGGTCDGATNVVRIVVEGGGTYNGSCSNVDGTYSIGGVIITGDPTLTVFLNDASGSERASLITKTPTADIVDADLYANRVIVRHEDVSALSIADMNAYDNADDSDVRFIAATTTGASSLTVLAGNELYVWSEKTFTPGGAVTVSGNGAVNSYDGSLYLAASSTFTAAGTTTYTVAGTFTQSAGASFVPASSTVVMNATSTGKAVTAGGGATISFHNLSFTGVAGGWNINSALALTGNMAVNAGTLTGTANVTLSNGSLSGNGILSFGSGTVLIARTNTLGGTQPWTFNNLTLGNGTTVGTTTPGSTATTTVGGTLTIANAHFLDAGAWNLNLSGTGNVFVETGTFLEDTSTVRYSGAGANVISTGYYNLLLNSAGGSQTYTATGIGIAVGNNLVVGGAAGSTFNLNTNDPALAVSGDVTITGNGTLSASNSGTFAVAGSWDNNGTFTANSGTITFTGSGSESIAAGASSFATARLTGSGSYTVSEHATATVAFSIANLTGFTLSSGQTLAVGGAFSNYVGGAATTWTGSTLYLYGGGTHLINPATTTDSYAALVIDSGTHIRSWNSDAATVTTRSEASLYSMDHANNTGDLYIYGDYRKTSGVDHWSYATDFDGTSLGGSSRKVDVFFENGATALYSGSSQLSVLGTGSASTTMQNQGSGTYLLNLGGTSSSTFSYYEVFDTTTAGLTFSGSAVVNSLSYGYVEVGTTGGSAITVGGTAINASPARTFTQNIFATSTGVASAVNVTATGTAVSSWRFTNHSGSIDGEVYDSDPDGDPGYLVWDDSAASITVAGRVYNDEGTTVSTHCDGTTNNIHVRVAGLTSYTTNCNASTGAYSVSGITYSPADSIIVYLDGESVGAAAVTADPVSNISNMDLYERRVIVRHESAAALSIDDMVPWDSSDDGDIPFTAVNGSPDTLTVPANYKLLVWTSKSFAPGGNVTLSGGGAGAAYDGTLELYSGSTWTSVGTQVHSIGGSLVCGAGATFTAANSTTTFTTSGAARTIDINNGSFYNVAFTGSGSWTIADTRFDVQGFAQTAGSLTLPTGTTTVSASFNATGGSFTENGPFVFDGTSTHVARFDGSNAGPLYFTGTGTYTMSDTHATSAGAFIKTAGSVTLPTGTLALSGGFENRSGTVTHSGGRVIISTAGSANLLASGSDLSSVTFTGGGTYTMRDSSVTLTGSLLLNSGALTLATSTVSVGGSFTVSGGTFNHATGTVLFNSTDTGETINPGSSPFYNAVFANGGGGWTIAANATTTHNFTLTTAGSFTQQSGTTLSVGGVFTNSVGGSATTWTGSTLKLVSGTEYAANQKSNTGDRYQTLILGANTDVEIWNSAATTTTVAASASLYSQDHAAADGSLYIYGDYHIGTTTEYWSYATDFDGTALGGSSRVVTVRLAANATTTVDGGTLNIVGTNGNETTITNQGSGTYGFKVTDGTFNALYYAFRNLNAGGLAFSGTPVVSSLTEGDFELAVNGGNLISLSSTTLNANASLVITGMRFATTTAITGHNVYLTGTTSNAWTFVGHTGNLAGEDYDVDGATACGSVRFDDSACLLTQQVHYRWRQDDGGSGVPGTEWFDNNWNKRQRVRIENADATAYTDAVVKLTVAYDADMQADFDDLRFTDASGTTTVPFFVDTYTASTEAVVWVKVPSLPASDIATVFMYYNNAVASSTSSSTSTFIAADDFEDGSIGEYSGNTSLFAVDNSFAYGGSYGLDNTGDESNFAADGIARFDQTVSQGETIRYMQYIDTTAGSGDETCTLFGVQSPVTNNQNYAVCLEQYGVDRMSLVENAINTDSTGTLLSSTTVTFVTGWYEVEVDWGTDDVIFVSLYQNDTLVATTSATDGTKTSGGIGFTYWYNYGGWDNYTSRTTLANEPTVYFGTEQTDGGASWAAGLDTTASSFEIGNLARLRILIENSGPTVTNQEYLLEYAPQGVAPSCEAVSTLAYTAVPTQASCGASPVCMQNSTFITDGDTASDLLMEAEGQFTAGEVTEDPSNVADPVTIDQNEYTELEYAVTPTANVTDQNLCFRVTNNGSDLDTYLRVARLSLRFDPTISNVIFNDGLDISLLPGTTTRVYATGTVTDLNGYTDFASGYATSTMYSTSVAGNCAANDNNCYIATNGSQCSYTGCLGNSCALVCYADFYYFAEPTDESGQDWVALMEVEDSSGGYDFADTGTSSPNVNTLHALDVTHAINYGSLSASSTTGATNASSTIENLGNAAIDINLNGVDLSDGYSSTIPVIYQKYATSTFNYDSCPTGCYNLSTTSVQLEVDLTKPTSLAPVTDAVYWGIRVPFGVSSAAHTGTNTFYAVDDSP